MFGDVVEYWVVVGVVYCVLYVSLVFDVDCFDLGFKCGLGLGVGV